MNNTDIECQVCHRISFAWDASEICPACQWPLRPRQLEEPVFGFDVAIEIRVRNCETKVVEKHFFTPDEKTARRRAKTTPSFLRVLAVRPLTETQWISGYGDPRDKSKFS
jgi:hypothetical protein